MTIPNDTISPQFAQNVLKATVSTLVLAAPAAQIALKAVVQAMAHWESQKDLIRQKDREIEELRRELARVRWRQRPM